jgi:hypothetical protein
VEEPGPPEVEEPGPPEVEEPRPPEVEEPRPEIVEEAEPAPEEPSRDGSAFDGLSMDLGPVNMEPSGSDQAAKADAEEPEKEGAKEGLLARELSKTKEDVAKLEGRLKEAVSAAQEAVAANERLNAIRRAIDGKDS